MKSESGIGSGGGKSVTLAAGGGLFRLYVWKRSTAAADGASSLHHDHVTNVSADDMEGVFGIVPHLGEKGTLWRREGSRRGCEDGTGERWWWWGGQYQITPDSHQGFTAGGSSQAGST